MTCENYFGKGIIESTLDYKFLRDVGVRVRKYENFNGLRAIVEEKFAKYGINTIVYSRSGNEYYKNSEKLNRLEVLELIKAKVGSELDTASYLEENFTWK